MPRANVDKLTERERACLEHFRQAQELGFKTATFVPVRITPQAPPTTTVSDPPPFRIGWSSATVFRRRSGCRP